MDSNDNITNADDNLTYDQNTLEQGEYGQSEPEVVIDSGETTVLPSGDAPSDGGNKKKTTIIIAVCAVVVIAVIVAVILVLKGRSSDNGNKTENISGDGHDIIYDLTNSSGELLDDEELESIVAAERDPEVLSMLAEATTKFKAEVGTGSRNVIVTGTTAPAAATSGSAGNSGSSGSNNNNNGNNNNNSNSNNNNGNNNNNSNTNNGSSNSSQTKAAEEQIKAFFNRKCYFEGTMYQDGEGSPMSISFNGDDYEVFTSLDGIEIAIMKLNGKMYMKRPGAHQYVELTDELLSTLGMSLDEVNLDLGSKNYSDQNLQSTDTVNINGKDGLCFRYKSETGYSEFYYVDGQIVDIRVTDSDLNTTTELDIDIFSTAIPSDQLTLNGYTKANSLFSMLSDMM